MRFGKLVRRVFMDFCKFFAIAAWFLFLYFKLWSFVKSAFGLGYVNVQTVTYVVYCVFLLLFAVVLVWSPPFNKAVLLRAVCIGTALSLFVGAVSDMISYKAFIGYVFTEGDTIFSNIVFGVPNIIGPLLCIITGALYVYFGFTATYNRYTAYIAYLIIILISAGPAFMYSYLATGALPRQTWIEKAAFLIPYSFFIFMSLTLSVSSKKLWMKNIW